MQTNHLNWDLLMRLAEIAHDAYRCPEWLQRYRTKRTDDTMDALNAAEQAHADAITGNGP